MSNMEIWEAVSKTDPEHTKRVTQRGGFTAIDAHYQIMLATRQFGPVGVGWGYDAGDPIFHQDAVMVPVTLWHGSRENTFGPVYGCAKMGGERLDTDAPKKAGTDALTKLLSQLGFNADVFLGKFDDNKYVQQRRAEEAQQKRDPRKIADGLLGVIEKCTNQNELSKSSASPKFKDALTWLSENDQPKANEVTHALESARRAFEPKSVSSDPSQEIFT